MANWALGRPGSSSRRLPLPLEVSEKAGRGFQGGPGAASPASSAMSGTRLCPCAFCGVGSPARSVSVGSTSMSWTVCGATTPAGRKPGPQRTSGTSVCSP